jgi:hypothetical protein
MNMLRPARAPFVLALLLPVLALLAALPAAAQDDFYSVTPCRVYDSRGGGGPLNQDTTYPVPVAGLCDIPADAKAVSLNVTIVGATGSGELVVFPSGSALPTVAVLPFSAGRTLAMFSPVALGTGGAVDARATMTPSSPGLYQLVLDVTGYFLAGPPVAVNDNYPAEKDTVLNVSAPGVTSNDTLNGAAIVSYGASTGAEQTTIGAATPTSAGGSVSLNADGSFSYTPPTGAIGIDDTFKYVLQNPGGTSTATVTIPVGKANQTISFTSTAPTDAKVGGATYTVTATATSGLTVTFTIDAAATSVCSIVGSTVSFIGAGTCVVKADQAGDTDYNPAPQVQQSFLVGKGDQTISFTSSPPATPTVGGATYTVTATATSGLAVTFTIDASAASVCSIAGSTVSFIGAGTCVINANQAGDANWNPAPQEQQSFGVKNAQTISFTSSPPATPTVGGATYNVTATATSGLAVTFTIDPSASTVCSIAGSTVSFIGNGTCVINANQAGDANYYAAPQEQQSFGVKTAQSITFTSSPPATPTVGGATYTVTATATSGLAVTFTIDPSASTVCSIAGSTVSFIGNGTCVINANQAGDATYHPAPQEQQSFAVKTAQTISFTSSPPATPTVGGATYNVTASATSGLAVTFTIDPSASTVCSIAGSTVSFIGNGTCVINANQAGDANYYAAPQVQQSFGVKTAQTISFTSSPPATPTVGGATYTVTATATSGLAVTFTIDPSASTVCSIAGSTVSFIGNGTCLINANQAGDANYHPAPQEQQSFGVKTAQTISFTSSPPAMPTVGGATYTVTATATSGLAVTFTIDASASTVCSIAGSTVSFIGNGTCVINANQAGDANYYAAPQVQQSFAVKSAQTITFTSTPPSPALVSGPNYTVTATASSSLPVTFTIDASSSTVCTIAGSTVSFIGAGTCVINANQAGDANYYAAPQVSQSVTVVKQDQTITFTSTPPALATIGGPTYTVTATATSGLPVTITIDASAASVCTISGSTVSFIAGGTCVINANQAGNTTYNPAPQVQQSFPVNFPPQLVATPRELFDTIGNTAFEFKAVKSLSPGVFVSGNLTNNFTDSDGPNALSAIAIVDGPTTNGGQVDVGITGEFTYTPKAGDTAVFDEFSYQITDGAYTVNRTVRINLRSRVWYVNNDDALAAPASDDGTSVDPFNTLAAAQTASSPNDYIFVYYGDGTTTNQSSGIALKNGQHLIGQFDGLRIAFSPAITFNGTAGTTSVELLATPAADACSGNPCRPFLDDTVAGAPEGVGAIDVIPAEIVGLNLAGNVNAIDWNTAAAINGAGTLTIRDNIVRSAGADGVDINLVGSGAVNLAFYNNNLTAGGIGLDIQETGTGLLTITAFNDNTVSGSTGGTGININSATFDLNPGGGFQQVNGNDLTIGSAVNPVGGSGLLLTSVQGNLFFDDLLVFSTSGTGLGLTGTGGGMTFAVKPASPDSSGLSTIDADSGAGVDISGATIDLRLSKLESNTSGSGLNLNNVSGQFRAPSGSSITKTSGGGTAFSVASSGATVNYAGTLNVTSGAGVSLTSNTGSVNFSGTLTLSTGGNPAFSATGGGVVTATDTASTLSTTTVTALNIVNTTIGANDLRFRSISSGVTGGSGPVNGINLNNTGTSGGLIVSGNGGVCTFATPTCTGGTIQSSTGDAVRLVSTQDVSLTRMRIHDNDTNGIYGDELTNFTLANSVVSDNDVANPSAFEAGIKFNELYGTNSITDTVVRGTKGDNIRLEMASGTLSNLTLSGATVGPTANVGGGYSNGFSIVTSGNPTLNVTVSSSLFTGLDSSKQQSSGILTSIGGGTTTLSVTGSDFEHENIGIDLGSSSTGIHRFNIDNNDVVFHRTNAVNIVGTSVIDGTVNNNRVGNGTVDSGSMNSFGIAASHRGNATWSLALTNNTVRNSDFEGIFVRTGDLLAGDSGTVNLTLTGNTVFTPDDNSGFPANPKGMHLRSRQATTLCMNIANNEAQGAGAQGYHLQESDTSSLRFQDFNTNAVTTLSAKNNKTAAGAPTTNEVGAPFAGACTPTLPSFP